MKNTGTLWFLLNLIIGLYLLNFGLKLVDITKFIPDTISTWVIVIGGALVIISGVKYLMRPTAPAMYRR
jgi:cytochrome c biogenesis protein CcdA